jgi:uncharacterized LabA/DUF88 family protein
VSEERLKIAVFIDFDNIEIGVKTTLGTRFDVGGVLEAIKERGEVVTKVAYGDWTRATEYGRSMSQHAIHMVQRNLTPGGDKNGADINLALDALEMAFTHSHINAFVIVGGDSDFITLVEKLKQYDRKVFVVGGRAFTSQVMQKNCTEFVAYEDLTGVASRGGRQSDRGGRIAGEANLAGAMPLVRRALKLLADREVLPQLGLLKSTLLQLDSSFSERAYGVSSFRDFVQKLAKAGYVNLKGTDRSFHVELREAGDAAAGSAPAPAAVPSPPPPPQPRGGRASAPAAPAASAAEDADVALDAAAPAEEGPPRLGPVEGFRIMQAAFTRPGVNPRWPMYVRQLKQFIRQVDESFDERKYGFSGMIDALRYGQREGLFRLERDRQGVVRVFAGLRYPKAAGESPTDSADAGASGPMGGFDAAPGGDERPQPRREEGEAADRIDLEGAEASPDGRDVLVDAITYDTVTHVDTDSGVIDVAPHVEEPSPAPSARRRGRKPSPPADAKPKGRRTKASAAPEPPAPARKRQSRPPAARGKKGAKPEPQA